MTLAPMDSMQRRRIEDRTRGRRRVRVVTALAAIGSGVLATVLSLLLTGTASTASTTSTTTATSDTGDTATQPTTQSNSDQLQTTQAPTPTDTGGSHGSSGGS